GGLARLVHPARAQPACDFTGEASGEHDQSVGKLGEDLLVDTRLVVEALLVRGGQQPAEVTVADTRLCEQNQVEVAGGFEVVAARLLRAVGALAGRDVRLASDDRLDAVLFRL